MVTISPKKLHKGSRIRVIAPSRSLGIISPEVRKYAKQHLEELGFTISFATHVEEKDDFVSSKIAHRVEDLYDAFIDPNVDGILTVIGGFNSNQLLRDIDWNIIKSNPKVFCGFSDITALSNAIFAKTRLVTYSGPHYSTFGQKHLDPFTVEYFKKCLMSEEPFDVMASKQWTDDRWFANQDARVEIPNEGVWVLQKGEAEGTILGANLCTFNLLQGTEFFPDAEDIILFLEDDDESLAHSFDRDLQSLLQQKILEHVRGIVIGRFQNASKISRNLLEQIISSKKELQLIPVIANVDFGHTEPRFTFPIGGTASISAKHIDTKLRILKH